MKNHTTLLFVPAKEKMLNKISGFHADAYILDLEDSIEEADKEQALERVCAFLEQNSRQELFYVRLNTKTLEREAQCLSRFEKIGFMLPKFERIESYSEEVTTYFKKHRVIALLETPKGLVNIEAIAACEWVDALALGAEDYTTAMNMDNSIHTLAFTRSRMVMYAKAYGKEVYDTPSLILNDENLLVEEIKNAVSLGFDGKLAISPKHIEVIRQQFGDYDMEEIKRIVALYEAEGKAVLKVGDKVYEKMHIGRMKKILSENESIL